MKLEEEEAENKDEENRVKVKLVELGPRIDMSVKKIEEGFLKGNVVYHSVIKKSKKEIKEIMEKLKLKNQMKKKRKTEQEKNIKEKAEEKEAKLTDEQREELRISEFFYFFFILTFNIFNFLIF